MKKISALVVALLVTLSVATGYAQVRAGSVDITPTLGMYTFEGNEDMDQVKPMVGLRLGYNFTRYIGLEGFINYGGSEVNTWLPKQKVDFTNYGVEGIFNILPNSSLVPFLAVGVGGNHYSYATQDTTENKKDKFTAGYGYGVKWFISDNFALRFDVRHVMPFDKFHNNMLVSLGFNFSFGGAKKAVASPVSAAEPLYEESKPQAASAAAVEETTPEPVAAAPAPIVYQEVKPEVKEEVDEQGRATLEVLFDFDKATIKNNYVEDIEHMVDVMKEHSDLNLTIEGHTDSVGKAAYNKNLSQRRADAVKDYMVKKGNIDAGRLNTIGYGQEKPVASNKTKDGRAKNRRVEAAVDYTIKK